MRIATIQGGSIYYHHNDHLGTPLALTDSNAAVVWSAAYKPFGEAQVAQMFEPLTYRLANVTAFSCRWLLIAS
jgi:uncharacterized protein RhaS with RHS repeats